MRPSRRAGSGQPAAGAREAMPTAKGPRRAGTVAGFRAGSEGAGRRPGGRAGRQDSPRAAAAGGGGPSSSSSSASSSSSGGGGGAGRGVMSPGEPGMRSPVSGRGARRADKGLAALAGRPRAPRRAPPGSI